MTKYVFSCGGGVQSTACLVLAAQGKIPYQTFIFANVGDKAEKMFFMLSGQLSYTNRASLRGR